MFEGDGNDYLEIEGRRYRQDRLMGGDHAVHRLVRRGIVEKLGFLGVRRGVFGGDGGMDIDEEAITSMVSCEGYCTTPVMKTRKRSVE